MQGRGAQNTSSAVMQQRREPPDSLDFFPTPPWATRALCEIVLPKLRAELAGRSVWECACGEGHMAEVLKEYARSVFASDVHDYGRGYALGSFVGEGLDVISSRKADWIITNPPFNLAEQFLDRALADGGRGVALLLRSNFIDTQGRYERVFAKRPPACVAQFAERVPMHKGRWDPGGDTATAYAWFIWKHSGDLAEASQRAVSGTRLLWIPPGQRHRLTRPDDVKRFTTEAAS